MNAATGTMNMHIPFDTLAYTKKLKNAGVPENVAEIQAEALAEIVCDRLATRQDLNEFKFAIKQDLKEHKLAVKQDLKELELRLTYKLTLRFGSMIAAAVAILSTIIKLH